MLPSGGVDVVVTELVDSGLLGEHIVPVLRHAATLLKPDGQLPVSVRASLSFDQSVGRSPQGRSSRSRPQCGQRPSRPLRCDLARLFPPPSLTRPSLTRPHSHPPPLAANSDFTEGVIRRCFGHRGGDDRSRERELLLLSPRRPRPQKDIQHVTKTQNKTNHHPTPTSPA